MSTLDLGLIGNGAISGLVDPVASVVWGCFPRFDGDPFFCALLREQFGEHDSGIFAVDLVDLERHEQEYLVNTPILVTRLYDRHGGSIEVTDFCPRFRQHGRMFSPMMMVRLVRRLDGNPRIRVRLHPARGYGREATPVTSGSNHVRYLGDDLVLRVTTDMSVTMLLEASTFLIDDSFTLLLGADETVHGSVAEIGRHFFEETCAYWRGWVRSLGIPFEWQDAVIRAAITLQLNVFEDTGAVVAAMTTSIPESPNSGRNWDYRFCWLRDAYFVVNALNSLGATRTMERYLGYILNIISATEGSLLRPVYGIGGRLVVDEIVIDTLKGYRGMGPVRVGNQAHQQVQHDVYGSAILAATHVFFDRRLVRMGDRSLFERLEMLGRSAIRVFDQPDAGIWEIRGETHVHTFSSMMCWAGCDRLARIAGHLGFADRAAWWEEQAARIHGSICLRAWNPRLNSFVSTMEGEHLDASLLRMNELGFLPADDPRFIATVEAIGRDLCRGDFIFRYIEKDDFGFPENAFLVCTFWYINALASIGRKVEARALFEQVLARRNRHGLLAEDLDPKTGEQWGNFVQTYSMVGIIDAATRLSIQWNEAF